jgi:hypothetical protein
MSLLTKSGGGLSGLAIDADKDWQGRLIKNLGLPVDDADALRKQDAILKALLTQAGQLLYASGPGTPAVLPPETGEKFLKAGAPPSWAGIPAGGFWELAGETILAANSNSLGVTGVSADNEILWIFLMSTWTHGSAIYMRFNDDSGPYYDYSRYEFGGSYSCAVSDSATSIHMSGPSGTSQIYHQFQSFVFQRTATWRKSFTINWHYTNSDNGSNTQHKFQGFWNNTASKVATIRLTTSANYFDAGARLVVLGAR